MPSQEIVTIAKSVQTAETKEMFLSPTKEEELHARILRAEADAIGRNGFRHDMQEFTMER